MTIGSICRIWLAGLLLAACTAASAQEPGERQAPGPSAGNNAIAQTQWQTFESCPMAERPCGPVCMPESFSCCDKASATICPPGQSCCGPRCGCGRCETCVENRCVPDRDCLKRDQSSKATPSSPASVAPAAILGTTVLIGILTNDSSDTRRPISP